MKKAKVVFGSLLVLLAISGAVVTQAHTNTQTRYIQNATSCDPIQSDDLCVVGTSGCIDPGTSKQLYAAQLDAFTCKDPLQEPAK